MDDLEFKAKGTEDKFSARIAMNVPKSKRLSMYIVTTDKPQVNWNNIFNLNKE